jgi:hypothetical protein
VRAYVRACAYGREMVSFFLCVCVRERVCVCVIEREVVGGDAPRVQRNKELEGSI